MLKRSPFQSALKRASDAIARALDPWWGSDGTYLEAAKSEVEDIAIVLVDKGRIDRIQYNSELMQIEFRKSTREVLASLTIEGEMCTPLNAIVWHSSLSEDERSLFERMLPVPVEFRHAA